MENLGNHDIMDRIQTDKELVAEFTSNMQLITKQTGVELIIDTSHDGVARMMPGKTRVFFNPIYTLKLIQTIQEKRAKEFGIIENFKFDIGHLSQMVLHEINHMINHAELKMSDKKVEINNKKMNMLEYEEFLHTKYGNNFHDFENMLEDIDVNNHATMVQAPVFEQAKQDIYHHITIPDKDFSKEPLTEQFGWTILRESMLPDEKCIVDPRVRACIDYLSEPGEALEKLRDPSLKYDEQLPIIHRLYEEYYLRFKEEDEKNQKKKQKENQDRQNGDNTQQGQQGNQQGSQLENQSQSGQSQQNQNGQSSSGNESNEQNESGNNSGKSNQEDDVLGKLRDSLRQALGGKKGGEDAKQEELPNESDSQQNQDSSVEQKQDTQKSSTDKSASEGQDSEGEKIQQKPKYRPGKPILLPHIFENLDEEGNSLLEQIEQSLKGGNDSQDSLTQKEKNESEGENGKTSQSQQIQQAIEQAIEEALQQQMEDQNKSPEERNLEAIIQQEWNIDGSDKRKMRNIKSALKRQERLKQQIKRIKDDNGQSVYDKITKDIFSKIVQIRRWNRLGERHARPFSEGGQLDPQNFVSGIMDWKAGNDDPRILKQEYKEQKEKQKAGGFSITFILDGSYSMRGERNKQQALSTLLMLYSLQQLNQDIKLEGGDMEDFLISTQAMMFCGLGQVALLKERGKELSVKDMIEITNALGYCNGYDTNACDAINEYYNQISKPFGRMSQKQYEERREKVKDGKLKEIVFVLSDGVFHGNPTYTIKKLREMGVIVCGIGITNDGYPILSYFGEKTGNEEKDKQGFGIVCEDAGELGNTLNELLVQHLEDPSIVG